MTVSELLQLYLVNHLARKPSAPRYGQLARQVFPPIAPYSVDQIPVPDLLAWWTSLQDRPAHACKAIGLYRAAHRYAEGLGLISSRDQTLPFRKPPQPMRSQTTSPEEWARIVPFLEDLKLRHRVCFWTLYLLGSRPGEVRMMRPCQLHLDGLAPIWTKAQTKNGTPHIVPLPLQLVPMLKLLLTVNGPSATYLFFGDRPTRAWGRTSMQKMWEKIRARAGLPHLWLNDLRRSTASDLLNQGENLGVIQKQLNHRSLSQTAKYAWLATQPLALALQRRADSILERAQPEKEHVS